ncbi:hypothetical protein C0992_008466 [Termitomyces sp. T32_za158]|nr:hypothetical protein C0992_008466 [Termitomyces sp. T32_za158]
MANSPQADIELLISSSATSDKIQADGHVLRIRFSRHSQSLEIARHLSDSQGEEWTKKTVTSMPKSPYISSEEWKILKQDEEDALHQLTLFVKISDVFEELSEKMQSPFGPATAGLENQKDVADSYKLVQHSPATQLTTTLTNSISSLNLAPRPSKISMVAHPTLEHTLKSITSLQGRETSEVEGVDPDTKLSWRENVNSTGGSSGRELQTRFIPSIGWCIRYASNISQGGRYRIMFLDGVALDIDVDEDWVEFKSQFGETTV